MDFNEIVSVTTESMIEHGPSIIMYAVLAMFAISLGFSSWKAATLKAPRQFPWRLYWGVCAALSWAALLGLLAFTSLDSVIVDDDGTIHENFGLLALSTMTGLVSIGLTLAGCIAAITTAMLRRSLNRLQTV